MLPAGSAAGKRTTGEMQQNVAAPCLGITLGDPAGVGPELVLRLLADAETRDTVRLVVYGSAGLLRQVAQQTGLAWPAELCVVAAADPRGIPGGRAPVLIDTPVDQPIMPGRVQTHCGRLACDWIAAAVRDARQGRIDAIVTAPICKAAIHAAGVHFPGHTEMLAELTASREVRMFFWSPRLAVGLVTIHIPLSEVASRITMERVLGTIRPVAGALRTAACPRPRIGVLGLNPHAGEGGLFGDAEQTAILPAIQAACAEGLDVVGPLVPDTVFRDGTRQTFDAFVAMYHDQGLIPFKMLAFEDGVNVTLGLPFCRTSPDHGTAFDIAWQGRASPASLLSAVRYARDHVLNGRMAPPRGIEPLLPG